MAGPPDRQREVWLREYAGGQGLPTTDRLRPSSSLLRTLSVLGPAAKREGNRALDLGCGAGRNTVHLARQGWLAVGVDFVPAALGALRALAAAQDVASATLPVCARLGTALPFDRGVFDLAIDVTASVSLAPSELTRFEQEVWRVVRPGGHFMSYVMADDDDYLGPRCDPDGYATVPSSGLVDRCFSQALLLQTYGRWQLLHLEKTEKRDSFYGRSYTRRLWWLLVRRPPAGP